MKNNFIFNKKGITLISLVVTIIVIVILAAVAINIAIGDNGLIKKTRGAKNETIKAQATEKMQFKITTAQMESYGKNTRMPTLKELGVILQQDNEIEYVEPETQGECVADIKITDWTLAESQEPQILYTKLKEYDYEFGINSSLQLASINGIKVADLNPVSSGGAYIVKLDGVISDKIPQKDTGYICLNTECSDENAQVQFNNENWTITWKNVTDPKSVCTLYFYAINNYKTLLAFAEIDGSNYSSIDEVCQDGEALVAILNNPKSNEYLYSSQELLNKISPEYICSNAEVFKNISETEAAFLPLLNIKSFREAMYSNYSVTQSIIANSADAKNIIKKSPYYKSKTHSTWKREGSSTNAGTTVLNERVFLFNVTVVYNSSRLNIGTFTDGTANYSLCKQQEQNGTVNYDINKFMTRIGRK